MEPAELLASMRRDSGLTQAELARRSGIPRTAINAYERGSRLPTATTLMRLDTKDWADLEAMAEAGQLDVVAVGAFLEDLLGDDPRLTRLSALGQAQA